jgi:hypothetical protein
VFHGSIGFFLPVFCVLVFAQISSCDRHQTVRERLGVDQGYETNLGDDTPFGYIYRMDTSHRHYGPDQPIHQHFLTATEVVKSEEQHTFPRYAMMVLSNATYIGADKPLWFEGCVSEDTAQRFE